MTAQEIIEEFQEDVDGLDDRTVIVILCEFIDANSLADKLLATMENSFSRDEEGDEE